MHESQYSRLISGKARTSNAHRLHGAVVALLVAAVCSSCARRQCCELPLQQVAYTSNDEARDRALVRLMLASLDVDSICTCDHVLIEPVVKRSMSLLATPGRALQPLFLLTKEDTSPISGAQSVAGVSAVLWPQWHREAPDTVSLAVFVADTAHQSDPGRRTLSVFVLLPGTGAELWTWDAWRCGDEWCGGPLKLTAQP